MEKCLRYCSINFEIKLLPQKKPSNIQTDKVINALPHFKYLFIFFLFNLLNQWLHYCVCCIVSYQCTLRLGAKHVIFFFTILSFQIISKDNLLCLTLNNLSFWYHTSSSSWSMFKSSRDRDKIFRLETIVTLICKLHKCFKYRN